MDRIGNLPANDRRVLFARAADRMRVAPVVVEKDFWVCWTLKRLFELPGLRDHLIFKGGTTLSKVYGIIHRFSEDIDLTIDRAAFGYGGEKDPDGAGSKKRREKMITGMTAACSDYVSSDIRESLTAACGTALGHRDEEWRIEIDVEVKTTAFDLQLETWEDSRDVKRLGRKTRLAQTQREILWRIFERVRSELARRKVLTQADVFSRVAEKPLAEKGTPSCTNGRHRFSRVWATRLCRRTRSSPRSRNWSTRVSNGPPVTSVRTSRSRSCANS